MQFLCAPSMTVLCNFFKEVKTVLQSREFTLREIKQFSPFSYVSVLIHEVLESYCFDSVIKYRG